MKRHTGHVVHLQDSKSGGWFILRDAEGYKYFAHKKSLLDPAAKPGLGHNLRFTILPPLPGQPLKRATELEVVKSARGGDIQIERLDGCTRLVLRSAGHDRLIGELRI